MTTRPPIHSKTPEDRFGLAVAARLSQSTDNLPYNVSERLRAAREQALAQRKVARVQRVARVSMSSHGGTLTLGDDGDEGLSLWSRLASALPLIALLAGLVATVIIQDDDRAIELAEVDAALLTDDLPPSAYTDPGFLAYLNTAALPASEQQ